MCRMPYRVEYRINGSHLTGMVRKGGDNAQAGFQRTNRSSQSVSSQLEDINNSYTVQGANHASGIVRSAVPILQVRKLSPQKVR